MENNFLQPSAKRISRKTTIKRSTYNISSKNDIFLPVYSADELKLLAMHSLIKKFEEGRLRILQNNEDQMELKLSQTGTNFCGNSTTMTIEPTKKQIVQLNKTASVLKCLLQSIQTYLKTYKKQEPKKSLNSTVYLSSLVTPAQSSNFNPDHVFKPKQTPKIRQTVDTKIEAHQANKQNLNESQNDKGHRRYWSNISFASKNSSASQSVNHEKKRQKCFLLKKKQQLQFLQKIVVDFNSEQAQFKALVENMNVFHKNLSRANYYLKVIDHSTCKCQKVSVYLNELIKIFGSIIAIFTELSKIHMALNLNEANNLSIITQFGNVSPLVQQYYDKSREVTNIMKHFSLSPVFSYYVIPYKKECSKLIYLLVQARYTLRYLEKEIENQECSKKQQGKLPKWQKAYRIKFLPKNTIC